MATPKLDKSGKLRFLTAAVQKIRETDSDFNLTQIAMLAYLYENESATVSQFAEMFDQPMSSASRGVRALSDWRKPGVEGYGMVDLLPDPADFRVKIVQINAKGKKFLDGVLAV